MEQQLSKAAVIGDIDALYAALASDPTILDRIDSSPFTDTPIHIAARAGQTSFALEIMILKPSLGRKLNPNGSTPMHLALEKEHGDESVLRLLAMDKELVRIKGRDGKTPLHCAAIGGKSATLLNKMITDCPESIKDITTMGETALHLCAKSKDDNYEAFKVMVQVIESLKMDEVFSWLDSEGCSILHHITKRRRYKMIKILFQQYNYVGHMIGVNLKYGDRTALDIIKSFPSTVNTVKIRSILLWSGALGGQAGIFGRVFRVYTLCRIFPSRMKYQIFRKTTTHTRDSTLVVIVLVIAAMFQVGLNPPGGFWQDDKQADDVERSHIAGTPIIASKDLAVYTIYTLFVSIGLLIALLMTKALTRGMPMAGWLQFSLLVLYSCYLLILSQPVDDGSYYYWYYPLALFSVYFIDNMDLRFVKKFVKRIFRSIEKIDGAVI